MSANMSVRKVTKFVEKMGEMEKMKLNFKETTIRKTKNQMSCLF